MAERFRAVLSRRHFVDREPGVLLVWLPAELSELAELVPEVEARHPGVRIAVHAAGAAVAVRMAAREEELAALEKLYVNPPV